MRSFSSLPLPHALPRRRDPNVLPLLFFSPPRFACFQVEFSSLDGAEAAVAKGGPAATGDGVNIEGRTVRLDYSQPRADRQAGGGGDRGGRGMSCLFLLLPFLCISSPAPTAFAAAR